MLELKPTYLFCLLILCGAVPGNAALAEPVADLGPSASMAEFCTKLPRADYAGLPKVDVADDWFQVYTVAPGVTAIYEPHQWQEAISYLIEGDDRALLFDTGNGIADIAALVAELTSKPVSVLNSHGHYDHVGGNYAFKNIYAMDTDFTRARQAGHANRDIAIEASAQALCRALPSGVTEQNHVGRTYAITNFVQDGHRFELGGRSLELNHLPGHTPDAIALLDKQNGLLWTGDSYYSGPIWLFAPETDLTAYRESLLKLISMSKGLKALLPAHNTPLADPAILPDVLIEFDAMLNGKLNAIDLGDGMVEYRSTRQKPFSFLMRNETLPYTK